MTNPRIRQGEVDKGHYKDVKLGGTKVSLTYDFGVSAAQKAALGDIIGQLSFQVDLLQNRYCPLFLEHRHKSGVATAKRDDGKAEGILDCVKGINPNEEIVMKGLPEREIGPRPEAQFEYIANDLPEARLDNVSGVEHASALRALLIPSPISLR